MNLGFHLCIRDWCLQSGTKEQYTRCKNASKDGRTCYQPEIRYGSSKSGNRPIYHPGGGGVVFAEIIPTWCKQLFPTYKIFTGTATYATDEASNANIPRKLFLGKGYNPGESVPTWTCRCFGGAWKDNSTKTSPDSVKCNGVKRDCVMASVTCQF